MGPGFTWDRLFTIGVIITIDKGLQPSGEIPLVGLGSFDVAIRPFQERGPIRARRVAAAVLTPGKFAINQSGFDRRKF